MSSEEYLHRKKLTLLYIFVLVIIFFVLGIHSYKDPPINS